jgi:hypothetical protein
MMEHKIKKFILILVVFTALSPVRAADLINKDRWLEIDLFWFERTQMKASSDRFWETMAPLFEDITGERGIILNIGWMMDFVLEWNGDLNSRIPLPKGMKTENRFSDEGLLLGSTEERQVQAADRFNKSLPPEVVEYEPWTYKDLKTFIGIFKESAERKGIKSFKVGTFVLGFGSIYNGNPCEFMVRHKPAPRPNEAGFLGAFDPTHILSDDNNRFGAYPNGFKAGLPITEFFGNQWGDFSVKIGFDALVLRDAILGCGVYGRKGPFGFRAPSSAEIKKWHSAYADMVRFTKQANPKALVMGYSNGAAAVSDWRVNCMDIESIAKEGYLDAYIDQTWAGAWNEVGQRKHWFWNWPDHGWTYQLGYMLLHSAILSETPVKHYFLTETFDTWESFNAVNAARQRLRWGIWAYSHAGVKTPDGYKFPDGSYISWASQAKKLLNEDEVRFLKTETNAAFRDLDNIKEINGPTLVYSRSAMEWQNENHPEQFIKEWIDEYAGSLMKWNVPILSAARIEHLDKIKSDLFIIQTPVHLKTGELAAVNKLIESGQPVLITGSPVGGIDPSILQKAGFSGETVPSQPIEYKGSLDITGELAKDCSDTFRIYQFYTKNKLDAGLGGKVIYSVAGTPALAEKDNLILWDAPELSVNLNPRNKRIMDELLGSPVPYAVLARLLTNRLAEAGHFHSRFHEINHPVWCGSWITNDGNLTVLTADLEEGLDHTNQWHSFFSINFPSSFDGRCMVFDRWDWNKYITPNRSMKYVLRKGESKLFTVSKQ